MAAETHVRSECLGGRYSSFEDETEDHRMTCRAPDERREARKIFVCEADNQWLHVLSCEALDILIIHKEIFVRFGLSAM
jgi:hypothetical protein